MMIRLPDIETWFRVVDGFPRPDWPVVYAWVDANVSEADLDAAWQAICRAWLGELRRHLGGDYELAESDNFVLLSCGSSKETESLLCVLEDLLRSVLGLLRDIASDEGYGKQVAIIFDRHEDYYTYISHFYPDEGRFGASGGVFLGGNYAHFALPRGDLALLRTVLAHELTHNCVRHLPLPMWLNEGIAHDVQHHLGQPDPFHIDLELASKHRAFWTPDTIQDFWRGESFHRADDGQMLSYHLSQLLLYKIRNEVRATRAEFTDFARHAQSSDAGDAAAARYLGTRLQLLVETFLGPGPWAPDPEMWEDLPERPSNREWHNSGTIHDY